MPTLPAYRAELGHALNDLMRVLVLTPTATTVIIPALLSTNASASANLYDDAWIYVATGVGSGQQRIIKKGSFVPSTGQITITSSWTPPGAAESVEISRYFPAGPGGPTRSDSDYLALINASLRRLNRRREITVPITTDRRLSLATWPRLDRQERILAVWEPSPTGNGLRSATWRKPKLVTLGGTSVLELRTPFLSTGGNLTIEAVLPADSWIKTAGAWGESSVGLVAETDEAGSSLDDVREASLLEAYQVLMSRQVAVPNGDWRALYERQLARVQQIPDYDFDWHQSGPTAPPTAPPAVRPSVVAA